MARHPLPTAKHAESGAFDHDPQRAEARENEPIPPGPLGEPPERWRILASSAESDEARILAVLQTEAWHELELNVAKNVLTISDRVLVEVYCSLVARHRAGQILKAAEYNLLLSCLARMGMTPSDRSRLNVPTDEKEAAGDTFSRLANTGRGRSSNETKQ